MHCHSWFAHVCEAVVCVGNVVGCQGRAFHGKCRSLRKRASVALCKVLCSALLALRVVSLCILLLRAACRVIQKKHTSKIQPISWQQAKQPIRDTWTCHRHKISSTQDSNCDHNLGSIIMPTMYFCFAFVWPQCWVVVRLSLAIERRYHFKCWFRGFLGYSDFFVSIVAVATTKQ